MGASNGGATALMPSAAIPLVDLSHPDAKTHLVRACQDLGFFKLARHAVPAPLISRLEARAVEFFSLPLSQKLRAGAPDPLGYGNRSIGSNGDEGWVEYLLLNDFRHPVLGDKDKDRDSLGAEFRWCAGEYVRAVRKMACEVVEVMAEGLGVLPRDAFSRLLKDEQSDSVFRVNHYPPCPPEARPGPPGALVGFGEHTDPQLISVLRSNNSSGLEISLRDGRWISVPPDEGSFFFNVGDTLQVMTNGRFKSLRHRVVANGEKSRVSMIYFGGPPPKERIGPLRCLVRGEEEGHYKEITWLEYKTSFNASRLADDKLLHFQKIAAS